MDIYNFPLVMFFCFVFLNPCYCLNRKLFNASKIQNDEQWETTMATWYGAPNGAGSDGGACGYGGSVENPPLSKLISAGGSSIFLQGQGCGACYEVKCTDNSACSGNPVSVMITDECPGCQSLQFDLSGSAFGSMANSGQEQTLINSGQINIQFRRVSCSFGPSIVFRIDDGATPYYFASEIEYENGDGDLVDIELKQAHESDTWLPMKRSWGATWALSPGFGLQPPFSIKLTEASDHDSHNNNYNNNNKTIVADSVIPSNWQPGQVYRSVINF